jgi:ankyrin repeat protein/WD40 repeat protein
MERVRIFFIVIFSVLTAGSSAAQVKLPEDFLKKMKKYDVVLLDTLLKNYTSYQSRATKFTSSFVMFKNAAEKMNVAFYIDTCRNHYNIKSELRKDLPVLFGFPPGVPEKISKEGDFGVVVNADDYAMLASAGTEKWMAPFSDYGNSLVAAYYSHATKSKIYVVVNFEGEFTSKSAGGQLMFYCLKFSPHLPNPDEEPRLQIQSGSNNDIYSLASSEKGKLLAYGGAEGVIKILNGDGSKELRTVNAHKKDIRKLAFSTNEKLIASCSLDSTIKLWEVESGSLVGTFRGHKSRVNSIAFFDEDRKLVSISSDSTVKIWEVETGKTLATLGGFKTKLGLLELSGGAKSAVVASAYGKIFLIDLKTYAIKEFKCDDTVLTDIAKPYSDLIVYSNGKAIKTIGLDSNDIHTLTLPGDSAYPLFTTKVVDGSLHIVMLSTHGYGKIYDYVSSRTLQTFAYEAIYNGRQVFYDVIYNYVYDMILFSSTTFNVAYSLKTDYYSAIMGAGSIPYNFYTDRKNEIVVVDLNIEINVLSLKNGRVIWSSKNKGLEVKGQGKINAGSGMISFLNKQNEIISYDYAGNLKLYSFKPAGEPESFQSAGNDSCFVYRTKEKEIYFHNPYAKNDVKLFEDHTFFEVKIIQDSFMVYAEKANLYLVNVFTQNKILLDQSAADYKLSVIGADAKTLGLLAGDSVITVYDLQTRKKIAEYKTVKANGSISAICFNSANNEMALSTFNNIVTVVNYAQGRVIRSWKPHLQYLRDPAYTADGKFFISCGADAFLKFWKTEDYSQVLTTFSSYTGHYISFTPDQYYVASVITDRLSVTALACFSLGNKVMELGDLDLEFNRPDIIAGILGYESPEVMDAYKKLHEKRLKRLHIDKDKAFTTSGRPILLSAYTYPPDVFKNELLLFLRLYDKDTGLKSLRITVNDVPFAGIDGYMFKVKHERSKEMEFGIILNRGFNKISIRTVNENGIESYPVTIDTYYSAGGNTAKPKLHIVGIGVSEFDSSKYNLKYPAKDVRDFVKLFQDQKNHYSKIIVDTLINERATRENIMGLKEKLWRAHEYDSVGVNDKIIFFIASHGVLDKNLDYYIATRDMNFNEPSQKGFLYSEIDSLLGAVDSRNRIVLIDACHSGEIDKDEVLVTKSETLNANEAIAFRSASSAKIVVKEGALQNSLGLMKEMFTDLSKNSGATVISSAGGTEYAIEGEEWNNGVFTYALINGLRHHKADLNNNGKVHLSELQKYIGEEVATITHGKQRPTSRTVNASTDVLLWKNDFNEELTSAIKMNEKDLVEKLIQGGADVSTTDSNGATMLMWAALHADLEMVKKLGAHKADFNAKGIIYLDTTKSRYYGSLMGIAALKDKLDLLKYLVEEKNLPVNERELLASSRKEEGWTPLMYAATYGRLDVMEYLLSKKADINMAGGTQKYTPALLAFSGADEKTCRRILKAGGDPFAKDTSGATIVLYAAGSSFPEVLQLALRKNKKALNTPRSDGYCPLHIAAWYGKTENFKILLAAGANVAALTSRAENILHMACYSTSVEILKEAFAALPGGINQQNQWGNTPLNHAALNRNYPLVEFLCEKGADITIKSNSGYNLEEIAKYYQDEKLLGLVKKWTK